MQLLHILGSGSQDLTGHEQVIIDRFLKENGW